MNQEQSNKALSVLLIDDSDVDNFINKAIISKEKCVDSIIIKSSGMDALAYLNSVADNPDTHPDVIFLDIRMPRMNGFEFLDEYIKLPEELKKHPQIFILSSSLDPVDSENAEKYDFIKGHLSKPLAHHNLTELLLKEA
ncbi:response regulator [Maribacter sp. MAR_2009_72]|uniref:response regulator n=1 Tax=Maribacter sp. MAR_2009_72 TaxID=1250050 RepID=UPI00119C1FE7|nr:response regulator [Maribacter sp. MAR_2009_72]TVZ16119.1 response regulator receiver domain-containing protein [Maribacter sp. MAR_2009_72]